MSADAGSADEDTGAYLDQAVFDLELDGSATTPAHCSSETWGVLSGGSVGLTPGRHAGSRSWRA